MERPGHVAGRTWCSVESCAMIALTISSSSKGDFSSKATSVSRMLKGGSFSLSTMNCCADMSDAPAPLRAANAPTVLFAELCLRGVAHADVLGWVPPGASRGSRGSWRLGQNCEAERAFTQSQT